MGDPSDPIINCALRVCCEEAGAIRATAKWLTEYGIEATVAHECASLLHEHFDLAEKGTLQPFKDSIARLARGADYKG
jgi:hypothetical protein